MSRKTSGDGRLEISQAAADRLRSAADALEVELGDRRARGRLEAMECTCQKAGGAHTHYFVVSELLKTLAAAVEVDMHLAAPHDGAAEHARVIVVPVA